MAFTVMLEMSSRHLGPEAKMWLDGHLQDVRNDPPVPAERIVGALTETGWIILDVPAALEVAQLPPDLRRCLSHADGLGFTCVWLSPKGEMVSTLPVVMPELRWEEGLDPFPFVAAFMGNERVALALDLLSSPMKADGYTPDFPVVLHFRKAEQEPANWFTSLEVARLAIARHFNH